MSLGVDTIDEYIVRIPHMLGQLERASADLWYEVELAEKEMKEARSNAWLRYKSRLHNGKAFSEKHMEHMVEVDPAVGAAHIKWAQLERKKRRIDGQIRKLRSMDKNCPGIQGLKNILLSRR